AVAPRPGTDREEVEAAVPETPIEWLDMVPIDISGTLIRERVAAGRSVRFLVRDSVWRYIVAETLYTDAADVPVACAETVGRREFRHLSRAARPDGCRRHPRQEGTGCPTPRCGRSTRHHRHLRDRHGDLEHPRSFPRRSCRGGAGREGGAKASPAGGDGAGGMDPARLRRRRRPPLPTRPAGVLRARAALARCASRRLGGAGQHRGLAFPSARRFGNLTVFPGL